MNEDKFMGLLYQKFPVTIEKGFGSKVIDTNGKEYIDCMCGYGVALTGHANPRVVNAIQKQLKKIITRFIRDVIIEGQTITVVEVSRSINKETLSIIDFIIFGALL